MGVFDYLRCEYPLEKVGANDVTYHTKDTDEQYLGNYKICKDGRLWHQEYDTEDRSDPSKLGIARLIGLATRVNKRWVPDLTTGCVEFYGELSEDHGGDEVEYSAYFVKGELCVLVDIKTGEKCDMSSESHQQAFSKSSTG